MQAVIMHYNYAYTYIMHILYILYVFFVIIHEIIPYKLMTRNSVIYMGITGNLQLCSVMTRISLCRISLWRGSTLPTSTEHHTNPMAVVGWR